MAYPLDAEALSMSGIECKVDLHHKNRNTMNYILSPEQELAYQKLISGKKHSIKYFDTYTAYQAMANMLHHSISSGEKVLVHIPNDSELRGEILDRLAQDGFSELMIDLGINQQIPEKDIIQMRATLKRSADIDVIIAQRAAQIKSETLRASISQYYTTLDKTVLSDVSVGNLATSLIYRTSNSFGHSVLPAEVELSFSSEEYYNLKKEVSKAAQLYQQRFELFESLDIIDKEIWSLESAPFDGVQLQIKEDLKIAQQLRSDFEQTLTKIDRAHKSKSSSKFRSLQVKLDDVEQMLNTMEITKMYGSPETESGFSLFGRKKKEKSNTVYIDAYDQITGLIKEASPIWFDQIVEMPSDAIDHDYMLDFLMDAKTSIHHYQKELDSSTTAALHRINKINTDSAEVIALDQRLHELMTSISENSIYKKSFVNNTLSFLKQIEATIEITAYLHKCVILLDGDVEYLDWMKFKNSWSPTFALAFDNLKSIPNNDWESLFEQSFFNRIVEDVKNNDNLSISQLQVLHDTQSEANRLAISALINQLHKDRVATIERLRTTSKEVHNNLFKKKTLPTSSWNDLILMNREFLGQYFPIHIHSDIKSVDQYDHVISWVIDTTDNDDRSIISLSPISTADLEEAHQGQHTYLYLNTYTYDKPLAQLTNSERLKASKKLAKYILSLNQNVKIYHTKTANIISLLPMYDDMQIENRLKAYGLKAIDTEGVLYDRLTESVLFTERKPYLLIKDHLINPRLANKLQWQAMLIDLFHTAGYKVVSLATSDQLVDNARVIDNTITSIMGDVAINETNIGHDRDHIEKDQNEASAAIIEDHA